jgi:hypothetical protein
MVHSYDSSQLLFVKPSALQFLKNLWTRQLTYEDAWFPGTETKSTDKDGLQQNLEARTPTIEKQQQQGNLPVNKG